MKINGNDLILFGLCFGIASTIILGKGYIFTDVNAIQDESTSYFGANPYAIRNKIIQKYEGMIGFVLVVPFAMLQLIGIYLSVRNPKDEAVLLPSFLNLAFLILLTICIIWGSSLISNAIAKQKYIVTLKSLLREGFIKTEDVLTHNGMYSNEQIQNQQITTETRGKRLEDIKERLKNWEKLFNFKRIPKETDTEYFFRLKEYLNSY